MAVAVAALRKLLVAVPAGKGARAKVRAHVVHDVAQLCELLLARQALQNLIEATCMLVQPLHFLVTFAFQNLFRISLLYATCNFIINICRRVGNLRLPVILRSFKAILAHLLEASELLWREGLLKRLVRDLICLFGCHLGPI